jgi:hypothetical protein
MKSQGVSTLAVGATRQEASSVWLGASGDDGNGVRLRGDER